MLRIGKSLDDLSDRRAGKAMAANLGHSARPDGPYRPDGPGRPDRRKFLLLAGLALAAGGGAVTAVAEALGRHHSEKAGQSPPKPVPRQTAPGSPSASPVAGRRSPVAADWAALRGDLPS